MRRFLMVLLAVVVGVTGLALIVNPLIPRPHQEYLSALEEDIPGPTFSAEPTAAPAESSASPSSGSVSVSSSAPAVPDPVVAPPPPPERVTTVLVVGSDDRSGSGNEGYGSAAGQRSDTTMIVQVNPYVGTTTIVSIPRDLWVRLPDCAGGGENKFNAAFSLGGLNCTVRLVRELTGVRLDHVVVLDFNAFKQVIDVLGGVQVCMNRPVKDRYSGLVLPAGVSTLTAEQALAFARSRHSTATGSDLDRISRQQYLMSRLLAEAPAKAKDPIAAWRLVHNVEPYVTVDQNFDAWTAAYLGYDALGTKLVTRTVPWKASRKVPWGSVALQQSAANKLFAALQNPPTQAPPTPSPSAPSTSAPSTSAPSTSASSPAGGAQPSATASASPAAPAATPSPSSSAQVPCID